MHEWCVFLFIGNRDKSDEVDEVVANWADCARGTHQIARVETVGNVIAALRNPILCFDNAVLIPSYGFVRKFPTHVRTNTMQKKWRLSAASPLKKKEI